MRIKKNYLNPPHWLSLVLGFLLSFTITGNKMYAQEFDYRAIFSDAEYYLLFGDFKEALPLYQRLYKYNPSNANINYRIGQCLVNIPGLKHQAIPYLEMAKDHMIRSYQEGSYREEGAPFNTLFFLGEAYRVNGMLEKAIYTYMQFRNTLSPRDAYNIEFVNQQIASCERAIEMLQDPCEVSFEPIPFFGTQTKYQYNPTVSYDGQTMVFTTQEKFYNAIYWVRKYQGEWGTPINITLDIGVEGEVYTTSLNADGSQLFLFSNDKGIGNIYTSNLMGGTWTPAKKLGKNINTRAWETHASISADGKMLLFTSNRKGGFGGLDIYYSLLQENGEWGPAQNMGSIINSPHNEEAPFLSKDTQTLYFASQGHNSIGGYDIFFSQRTPSNQWANPTNMGYPINTPDDDFYYFPLDNSTGLVALVEQESPLSRTITRVKINHSTEQERILLVGNLILMDGCQMNPSLFQISLFNSTNDSIFFSDVPNDSTGRFEISTQAGSYRLVASGMGYNSSNLPIEIPTTYSRPRYPIDVQLIPQSVADGNHLIIRSILFDFDSYELNNDAMVELEKLHSLMLENPSLIIEVTGHTDNMGSSAYNQKLSEKRAETITEYLKSKGIASERLLARAVSTFENIASNTNPDGSDNPEGRRINRRACISVINTDRSIAIKDDLNIPEHLKPKEQKFTILINPINHTLSTTDTDIIHELSGIDPQRIEGKNSNYAFTVGNFSNKSEAISLLNTVIEKGYQHASMIAESELDYMLNLISRSGNTHDSAEIYTIQLLSQNQRVRNTDIFKGLDVQEIESENGLYVYVFGDFLGRNAANEEIERIKLMGFPNAKIANKNTNYTQ